ncbi:hypothetical protein DM01DRAFT_1377862 [Hesseltinella vesiculosa]|uniref:Helicase C-terminal domain-containing protein n=1 Tax=Hesseltinella vesiculosa TaxID=101127 RepID=A0A1X2G6C2_9FUNG|nr:hypothetical protein DM01DRAFT_1377862 [Hesseltinella vesiculosa]
MAKTIKYSGLHETLLISAEFLERVDDLVERLNKQLEFLDACRQQLKTFLTATLVDTGEDDVKGDEYDDSLVTQEKCDIYQDVYQDTLRDRYYLIHGIWSAPRTARPAKIDDNDTNAPEKTEEIKELCESLEEVRKELTPPLTADNLQQVIGELREKMNAQHTNEKERIIIKSELTRLSQAAKDQRELQEALDVENRKLSALGNHRIEYYRSLQHISDQVITWANPQPALAITRLQNRMEELNLNMGEKTARLRYLLNLAKEKKEQHKADVDRDMFCLICKEHFQKGIVTYCSVNHAQPCGLQQVTAAPNAVLPATLKQNETRDQEDSVAAALSSETLQEINRVGIHEGLGGKLDSIIRHIQYIRVTSNGKCLVFSQWRRVLDLIASGLDKNNIGYVNLVSGGKKTDEDVIKFRQDSNTNVMLMHGKSQSSGLTLVEAKTVFIVEPMLNESLEKQAISRVHRIGQTEQTTVYWYIVQGTIEERIQDVHDTKQRHRQLEHQDIEGLTEPPRMQQGAAGGEYVNDEDLRQCFTERPALL